MLLAILDCLEWLMAGRLYGYGMRLRFKEIDFEIRQIIIRDAKGQKDRVTMLPDCLIEPLRRQLVYAKSLHESDLSYDFAEVYPPLVM